MLLDVLLTTWTSAATLLLVISLVWIIKSCQRPKWIPPGPIALPIFGNLALFRKDPRVVLQQLQKKHGDIYSLYFGKDLAVVIHGFDLIKEAFVKRGDVFSGRPSNRLSEEICPDKGLITLSGEKWKRERKLTTLALGDLGFRKACVEERILKEVDSFTKLVSETGGKPFDICLPIHISISNVICSFVLGKRFEHTDKTFQDYIRRLLENYRSAGATAALNYLPFLDFLPGDLFQFKKTVHNIFYIVNFIGDIVKKQLTVCNDNDNVDKDNPENFITAYVKRVEESGGEVDVEQLTHAISHLFVAGTESVATAIRWIFFYLCKFPEVQQRIHNEIDSAIQHTDSISWDDRHSLPFTIATTMEVMRHADLAPMGVAHSATEDTYFRGYFIPKGTMLIPYIHGVLRDETVWKNAEEFNPERFLDDGGKVNTPEQFIPYSIGRRTCIGEHLAKMEIFLFVASILRDFRLRLDDGPQPDLYDSQMGLTVTPMPFKLIFERKQKSTS